MTTTGPIKTGAGADLSRVTRIKNNTKATTPQDTTATQESPNGKTIGTAEDLRKIAEELKISAPTRKELAAIKKLLEKPKTETKEYHYGDIDFSHVNKVKSSDSTNKELETLYKAVKKTIPETDLAEKFGLK